MSHVMTYMRFYRLSRRRKAELVAAALALTAASAAVALLPFRIAIAFGSIPLGPRTNLTPEECVSAVEAAARRLPWRTVCIEKGLAVQRLLRRSGIDAVLHYGARNAPDHAKVEAHVWVSVNGIAIIGGEEARGFAEVANFPE